MIKEISNTDTGVVFLDNLWGWERYFGALYFYYASNCWYFITFLKTLPTIVTPRLSNHYTATTLLVYWKSMSPLFISLSFLIIAILFRSLRTVPRQYISLSKSFSNNIRTTVSSSPSLFFLTFFHINLIQTSFFAAASTPSLETRFYWLFLMYCLQDIRSLNLVICSLIDCLFASGIAS